MAQSVMIALPLRNETPIKGLVHPKIKMCL